MFSLVIPIFNEEKLIDELLGRCVTSIESFTDDYEIIVVDDGSMDLSLDNALTWQKQNNKIKILSLSKNFGHQAAFTAGLEYARGEIVGMMDGDLQDPPELLPEMYHKLMDEEYDVVSGKRSSRRGKKGRNRYSILFHILFRQISEIKNIEDNGNFSLMRRNAVEAILSMREKVRYLPGLRTFVGFRQGNVEYIRDDRFRGEPKMSIGKLFILASDAVFSFSRFPIRLCLVLGIVGTLVFMAAGIYVVIAKISGYAVSGWSSTLLSIYFLGSIQLVFLGILGEYVYRNYKESQNRPLYFVRKYYDIGSQK